MFLLLIVMGAYASNAAYAANAAACAATAGGAGGRRSGGPRTPSPAPAPAPPSYQQQHQLQQQHQQAKWHIPQHGLSNGDSRAHPSCCCSVSGAHVVS